MTPEPQCQSGSYGDEDFVSYCPLTYLNSPLGSIVYVNTVTGIQSPEDEGKMDMELIQGLPGTTAAPMRSLLSLDILGLNMKPVFVDGGTNC